MVPSQGRDDALIGFRPITKQKARSFDRTLRFSNRRTLSGSLVCNGCVVTVGVGLVAFTLAFRTGFGLGAAARALGELALDFLDRFGLRRMLDDGDFARQAIERCFIQLAFAVGLFRLRLRA